MDSMDFLVTYDVNTEDAQGRRRLRHVATVCLNYGQRVQKSVFECSVSQMKYEEMKYRLLEIIDRDKDSLRIYRLPARRDGYVEHFGQNATTDFDGPLVV
jgi:CRISPR-associated protein Cas2